MENLMGKKNLSLSFSLVIYYQSFIIIFYILDLNKEKVYLKIPSNIIPSV